MSNVYGPKVTPLSYDRSYTAGEYAAIKRALTFSVDDSTANPRSLADRGMDIKSVQDFRNANRGSGFQNAIDWVSRRGPNCGLYVPDGVYVQTLELPSFVRIYGESRAGTQINLQNTALTGPVFVNQDASEMTYTQLSHMTVTGGDACFDFSNAGVVSNLILDDFRYNGLTVGAFMNVATSLETSRLNDTTVYFATSGITCAQSGTNANLFTNTEWIGLSGRTVDWQASQANLFLGGRIELGGIPGQGSAHPAIKLVSASGFTWLAEYFEATHEYLVTETSSQNGVMLRGRFTGAADGSGGFIPFEFSSDGIIDLPQQGSGLWNIPMDGPAKVCLSGIADPNFGNNNAVYTIKSKQHSHFTSRRTTYSTPVDLIAFTRGGSSTTVADAHALSGTLTVHFYAVDGGSAEIVHSLEYRVFVRANSTGVLTANLSSVNPITVPNGTTFNVSQKAGATATAMTLEGVFTGMPALGVSVLQWEWSDLSSATSADTYITADLP